MKAKKAETQLPSCGKERLPRASAEKVPSLIGAMKRLRLNQVSSVRDVTRALSAMNEGPHQQDMYEDYDFVDDISGKKLSHELAKAARRLDLAR